MNNIESSSPPETSVSPAAPAAKPVRKDRLLVRGAIGVLLVVLAVEAVAYGRMMVTHWRLSSELQKAERENYIITRERVDAIFGRPPDEQHMVKAAVGEERYDVYYVWGLLKRRELCVHYGVQGLKAEPEVLEVTTIIPDEVLAN